jgi:dTDP-4-dehydrorhamnose 3,5-epimerase
MHQRVEWPVRGTDTGAKIVLTRIDLLMVFIETKLKGAYLVETEPIVDERGFFARTFCREEFTRHGLNPQVVQCNLSYNREKGTLRGMHYQISPRQEVKLVSCVSGSIYDVIVDLRSESPTYCEWVGVELGARRRQMLYIPEGFAHGFQTLEADAEVFYQMSEFYAPECARGVRWDDPAFAVSWPVGPRIISARDRSYPDFHGQAAAAAKHSL